MRALALTLLLPIAACGNSASMTGGEDTPGIAAQGTGTTRTFPVDGFTAVDLRGSDDVDVRVGPGFSVRADGDSDVLDRLKITKEGTTLRIGRRNGMSSGQAKVSVTLPQLIGASAAGSGDMTVDRVAGPAFTAAAAGSGSLNVAALQVARADVSLAGSGDVTLAGTADSLKISIAGSGDVEAGDLKAKGAEVSIAGSGSARAEVDGPAKVSVMGSGNVDLGGGAQCEASKMGSGSIRCGN